MKKGILFLALVLMAIYVHAQTTDLPRGFAPGEREAMPAYLFSRTSAFATAPPASPVRTIGEWEELQGLTITWTSYQSMLREIVRAAGV